MTKCQIVQIASLQIQNQRLWFMQAVLEITVEVAVVLVHQLRAEYLVGVVTLKEHRNLH